MPNYGAHSATAGLTWFSGGWIVVGVGLASGIAWTALSPKHIPPVKPLCLSTLVLLLGVFGTGVVSETHSELSAGCKKKKTSSDSAEEAPDDNGLGQTTSGVMALLGLIVGIAGVHELYTIGNTPVPMGSPLSSSS